MPPPSLWPPPTQPVGPGLALTAFSQRTMPGRRAVPSQRKVEFYHKESVNTRRIQKIVWEYSEINRYGERAAVTDEPAHLLRHADGIQPKYGSQRGHHASTHRNHPLSRAGPGLRGAPEGIVGTAC